VNTNIDDKLFYFYGVKPLEKEFQNFEMKVCAYLMETHGFTKFEAFQAWQLYKLNVKMMHIANFGGVEINGQTHGLSMLENITELPNK
jgi:hypothetical protein